MTTLGDSLHASGVRRRAFLKFCTALTSLMALPPGMAPAVAQALTNAKRPSVIWLSFQECTGCTESLTRTSAPTLENLILDLVSLDYIHALQASSGFAAEEALHNAMKDSTASTCCSSTARSRSATAASTAPGAARASSTSSSSR
jgi:hydrogenase small subunit